MSNDELIRHIDELHDELARVDDLDAETAAHLKTLLADARELTASSDEPHTIGDRISQLTARLEASHPRLTNMLGDFADTLAKLGI